MTSDDTKVVYTFFAPNYLYFTWLRGDRSKMVGKRSRGLFVKGLGSLFGVCRVSYMDNPFLTKIPSMAHNFTIVSTWTIKVKIIFWLW